MSHAMTMNPCSFCRNGIPPGAVVCTGCQAEKHVGAQPEQMKVASYLGVGAGVVLAWNTSPGILYGIGMAIGGGAIAMMAVGLMLSSQVIWKRRQRTL